MSEIDEVMAVRKKNPPPVNPEPAVPAEPTVEKPAEPAEPVQEPVVEQKPVQQPAAQTPAEKPAEPVVEQKPAENGITDPFEAATEEPAAYDWSNVSSRLGKQVTNEEDLFKAWDEREPLTYASEDVRLMNDMVVAGIDPAQYANQYDPKQINDSDYVYNQLIGPEKYTPEQAKEKMEEWGESEIGRRGGLLRDNDTHRIEQSNTQRDQLLAKYRTDEQARKQKNTDSMRKSIAAKDNVDGYKMGPVQKQGVEDWLLTEVNVAGSPKIKMVARWYNPDGSMNHDQMADDAYKLQNWDAITTYLKSLAKNNGAREVIEGLENVNAPVHSDRKEGEPQIVSVRKQLIDARKAGLPDPVTGVQM